MASFVYNNAKAEFLKGNLDWENDTFKVMLVKSTYVPNPDHVYVNAGLTTANPSLNEVDATNYTGGFNGAGRKTLASKAVNTDNVNDRAEADAADVVWTTLGGASNNTIGAALIIKEVTNDADSLLIACIDPTDIATNGADVTLQFNAEGIFYI